MTVTEDAPPRASPAGSCPRSSASTTTSSSRRTCGTTWLPERFRDRGPKVERRGIGDMKHIGGGQYEQTFDPDGPQADCWVYEDLVYIHKRHVAAVGFDRDDMTMSPITYDEMRPGATSPKARVEDMEMNHVEASLCFPIVPAVLRPDLHRGQGPRARRGVRLRLQRLDGRGVVRRLRRPARSRSRSSRCGTPSWPPPRCAATPTRGVHAVCFSEIPPHLGLPSIHTGDWDPFFAACEETETVICMHIGSSSRMPATSADAPVAVAATLSFNNAMASMSDWLFSGVLVQFPDAEARLLRGPDRLDPLHPRAGRQRVAGAPGVGRRGGPRARAAVDLLLPPDLRLLLPRPARPRRARQGRRGQHHLRDRLPAHRLDVARHQAGRHRADGGRRPPTSSRRSCAATPAACSRSTEPLSRLRSG